MNDVVGRLRASRSNSTTDHRTGIEPPYVVPGTTNWPVVTAIGCGYENGVGVSSLLIRREQVEQSLHHFTNLDD